MSKTEKKQRIDYIIELGEDVANWIGIIFISLFANMLITICLQEPIFTLKNGLLLFSSICFLFSGWKFLKSSSGVKKAHKFWELNNDNTTYSSNKRETYNQQFKAYITKRWLLVFYPILAFVFLILPIFFQNLPKVLNDDENDEQLYSELQDYNDWYEQYDAISNRKNHHNSQYELINTYLSDYSEDTLKVYDIASGTGDLYTNLKKKSHHVIYASDGSTAMIAYSENKHKLKKGEVVLKEWQKLFSTNDKYDVILLLGNSIASIQNEIERDSIVSNILSSLSENGKLLVDFDFSMQTDKEERYAIQVGEEDYTVLYSTFLKNNQIIEEYELESLQRPKKKIKTKTFTYSINFTDSLFVTEYFKTKGDFKLISAPDEYRYDVFELTKK